MLGLMRSMGKSVVIEQGVNRIDGGELTRKAIEMSQGSDVVWYREQQIIEPHPLQNAPHEGEERSNLWALSRPL